MRGEGEGDADEAGSLCAPGEGRGAYIGWWLGDEWWIWLQSALDARVVGAGAADVLVLVEPGLESERDWERW